MERPFSMAVSTERQRVYSAAGRASVTRAGVIDAGRLRGKDRRNIGQALATARTGVPVKLLLQGSDVVVDLGVDIRGLKRRADGRYLRKAATPIGRGENAAVSSKNQHRGDIRIWALER